MKRKPTIEDVARKASLSISTISLVINNKSNVSNETREKVQKAIDELGYHPKRGARGLASNLTGNIGFILSHDHFSLAEPFYTKIFLGAEFAARDLNYYVLLTTVSSQKRARNGIPRFLPEQNVDGVIIAGKVGEDLLMKIEQFGIPVVLIDYNFPRKELSNVCIDNSGGVRAAVGHLVEQGFTDIGFIGGELTHPSILERFNAYRMALEEHGIVVDDNIISTGEPDTGLENGFAAASRMHKESRLPAAILAANDAMAIGCMQYLKSVSLMIPEDVAVVGFDDIEMSSHIEPRLTTVRVFKEEMGKLGVKRLVEMIKSQTKTIVTVRVPVQLMVRESTVIQHAPNKGMRTAPAGAIY
jgi:LacI family transcriptional regulator